MVGANGFAIKSIVVLDVGELRVGFDWENNTSLVASSGCWSTFAIWMKRH
jgi:hypothetical protein